MTKEDTTRGILGREKVQNFGPGINLDKSLGEMSRGLWWGPMYLSCKAHMLLDMKLYSVW